MTNPKTTEHMVRQRLIRIETKVSRMMEYFNVTEDRSCWPSMGDAYDLIAQFQETINGTLEGDHPAANDVEAWLTHYEKSRGI